MYIYTYNILHDTNMCVYIYKINYLSSSTHNVGNTGI